MDDALIRVEGLEKRYGQVAALAGISLRVDAGEFIAFLGPSGCGKTTLLRAIAGFIEPSRGEIWIAGRDMTRTPPNRRPVNTVFQNYALFPHYTVAENIAFGPRRNGVERGRLPALVDEALALVGMDGFGARYPAQLSGGQQQRVALARALVNKPRALLLDEPLGALDLKLRRRMQLELKRLHQTLGMTFLFVTHDQEEALTMADRIAVMQAGQVVQVGTGQDIYRRPNCCYVADFIGEANLFPCSMDSARRLHLADGGTPLPYRAEAAAEGGATLLVRPESIALGPGVAGETVTLQVRVREKIFVGGTVKIYAQLGNGQEVVMQPDDRHAIERVQPGDTVDMHWQQADASVLLR
jgi:spermidine/putrescine transport system ATP-binding protein